MAAANDHMFICSETGKAFEHTIQVGESLPIHSPYSGKDTGYPATACYWTADGQIKSEPSWVLLNSYVHKPGPTFCPDCGRLVTAAAPSHIRAISRRLRVKNITSCIPTIHAINRKACLPPPFWGFFSKDKEIPMRINDSGHRTVLTTVRLSAGSKRKRSAFTLVELLVVIGIIALLVSVLLPVLTKARRAANTVYCSANLRQIGQAMISYTAKYHGAIPGNPSTTGNFLFTKWSGSWVVGTDPSTGLAYSYQDCPNIVQSFDWESAIYMEMGGPTSQQLRPTVTPIFDTGPGMTARNDRFMLLSSFPVFQCPENQVVMGPYSGDDILSNAGVGPLTPFVPMQSYNTSTYFQDMHINWITLPSNYYPNIARIGRASEKIFMADGGKYPDNGSGDVLGGNVDYDRTFNSSASASCYADYGPFDAYSTSYHSTSDYANSPMVFATRHGSRTLNDPNMGNYRFNCLFFDGHVETLDGETGSNPALWCPSGSIVPQSEVTQDAYNHWFNGQSTLKVP